MLPVIALVGRPNVGKSTLFNRLTASRDAIVDDRPGVTRDRLYGRGKIASKPFLVVDTGGITFENEAFDPMIMGQVELLLEEANELLFLVDGKEGLHPHDEQIAQKLRKTGINVTVLVNKIEGRDKNISVSEFQKMGLGQPIAVSASRGDGVKGLLEDILSAYRVSAEAVDETMPRVALVGRPNVGKSTLTNALLGEQRVIVSEVAGTTRDSVSVEIEHQGEMFRVTDTAGVRRRSRVDETIEKFSVIKTLQAIEHCNVAVLVLDAQLGISTQDVIIATMIQNMGRALVIAINKWDGLDRQTKAEIQKAMELKFPSIQNIEVLHLSAKFGTAVGNVLPMVKRAYDSAFYDFNTAALNKFLEKAVERNAPPMKRGRKIKIKFGHQAGKNPPVVVVHGNQVDQLPKTYIRYLQASLADTYRLVGVTVRIIPRLGENPFEPDKTKRPKQTRKSKSNSNARRKMRR
ncbi:MAG: ribosome biogenesis GTPase Der [Arenicellales bacterium]